LFFFRFVASGTTRSADSSFETCKGCQRKPGAWARRDHTLLSEAGGGVECVEEDPCRMSEMKELTDIGYLSRTSGLEILVNAMRDQRDTVLLRIL
jgi:hypothetical protein